MIRMIRHISNLPILKKIFMKIGLLFVLYEAIRQTNPATVGIFLIIAIIFLFTLFGIRSIREGFGNGGLYGFEIIDLINRSGNHVWHRDLSENFLINYEVLSEE